MSKKESDIVTRLRDWAYTICTVNGHVPPSSKAQMARDAAAEIERLRVKVAAIEAMGYEWRWTKSIDGNGEQVGVWVMRHKAAEADANNEAWRKSDGE